MWLAQRLTSPNAAQSRAPSRSPTSWRRRRPDVDGQIHGPDGGFFDSGVGGLTVLREIIRRHPDESTVYLGDNARAPYGVRPDEEVLAFSTSASTRWPSATSRRIVVACNTSTAVAIGAFRRRYDMPMLGVDPAGRPAAALATRNRRVGVIATPATIRSHAYFARSRTRTRRSRSTSTRRRRSCRWSRPGMLDGPERRGDGRRGARAAPRRARRGRRVDLPAAARRHDRHAAARLHPLPAARGHHRDASPASGSPSSTRRRPPRPPWPSCSCHTASTHPPGGRRHAPPVTTGDVQRFRDIAVRCSARHPLVSAPVASLTRRLLPMPGMSDRAGTAAGWHPRVFGNRALRVGSPWDRDDRPPAATRLDSARRAAWSTGRGSKASPFAPARGARAPHCRRAARRPSPRTPRDGPRSCRCSRRASARRCRASSSVGGRRPRGWVRANHGAFRRSSATSSPHCRPGRRRQRTDKADGREPRVTTRQLGFLLGFWAHRVLGQYDLALLSAETAPGRLLFVEENIRATARALGVPHRGLPHVDRPPRDDPRVRVRGPSVAAAVPARAARAPAVAVRARRPAGCRPQAVRGLGRRWRWPRRSTGCSGFMSPSSDGSCGRPRRS